LLSTLALRRLLKDPERHTVGLIDEFHFLGQDPGSRRMLQHALRMGGAFNTLLILCTQTVTDIADLVKLIGAFVALGFTEGRNGDIALACTMLGREGARELAGQLTKYDAG